MKRIYNCKETEEYFPQRINPELWTAIIPAAGLGLRLKYDKPKILFPIAGKPILTWQIELLSPFCNNFVFIFSPSGKAEVEPILEKIIPNRYKIAIQEKPNGMGDAVLKAKEYVLTKFCLIVWGDQAGIKKETIERCMRVHEHRENALLTCPTIWKKNPYIHFQRDQSGKIIKVLQAREEASMPNEGENDCGLFLFSTKILFDELSIANINSCASGAKTGEFNLLPIIPSLDKNPGNVVCLHIIDEEETWGVNTPDEAVLLTSILNRRTNTEKYV